jgi:hypothetical protein
VAGNQCWTIHIFGLTSFYHLHMAYGLPHFSWSNARDDVQYIFLEGLPELRRAKIIRGDSDSVLGTCYRDAVPTVKGLHLRTPGSALGINSASSEPALLPGDQLVPAGVGAILPNFELQGTKEPLIRT